MPGPTSCDRRAAGDGGDDGGGGGRVADAHLAAGQQVEAFIYKALGHAQPQGHGGLGLGTGHGRTEGHVGRAGRDLALDQAGVGLQWGGHAGVDHEHRARPPGAPAR